MSEKVTTYLPPADYTRKQDTIPRHMFDAAAEKINDEITETNLTPTPTGLYVCESDYTDFILDKMVTYIQSELTDAEGAYRDMLLKAEDAVKNESFGDMVAKWEELFLQSQINAIAQYNADVNPGTGLPYVPPTSPYVPIEAYAVELEAAIGAPPGIVGTAVANYMINTYNVFGV